MQWHGCKSDMIVLRWLVQFYPRMHPHLQNFANNDFLHGCHRALSKRPWPRFCSPDQMKIFLEIKVWA